MDYQSGAVRPVDSFGDGWSIIKNDYWIYVAMSLVAGIIVIVVSFILSMINGVISGALSGVLGVATSGASDAAKMSASIAPQIIGQAVSFFTNIIVATLTGIFFCGFYKSMSRVAGGGRAEFGDLFSGFGNLQACFIVAVLVSVIQFIIAIAMLVVGVTIGVGAVGVGGLSGIVTSDGQINPAIFGGMIMIILAFVGVYLVVMLIFSALTILIYPLIGERNLSGGQAFIVSLKSGLANLGGLILLLIVGGLMLFVGAIPCGLGLPFVFPFYLAAIFAAYRSVFGSYGDFQNYSPPPPPNFGHQPGY